jgi:hypothetical protein
MVWPFDCRRRTAPPDPVPLGARDVAMEADGVMRMGGTMVCVQRCFGDAWMRERGISAQRSELIVDCFHSELRDREREEYVHGKCDMFQDDAWDFLVLVMDVEMRTILATCLVEHRCKKGKDSQLYICDLCTRSGYDHLGMGTQMIQGVRWLGCLIASGRTTWREPASAALYLTLTVKKGDDAGDHVSRLYRRCGFVEVKRGGSLDYPSNNQFISFGFMFEESADHTPMCALVERDVVYWEAGIDGGSELIVYAVWSSRGSMYFHSFPAAESGDIQRYGLVNPLQRSRILKKGERGAELVFDAQRFTAKGVFFTRGDGAQHAPGGGCLVIRTSGGGCDRVVSHGSIPPYFGVVHV